MPLATRSRVEHTFWLAIPPGLVLPSKEARKYGSLELD
jgi:hypothetical protein